MEPQEVETIIRSLAAAIAQQGAIHVDIRTCVQELRDFNAQQVEMNARLEITQARIETLLARLLPQSENGREA